MRCPKCGQEIIVECLKIGEVAKCQNCGAETIIPANNPIETKKQSASEQPQSPQQVSKPQSITPKKAIIIGFLTGVGIAVVGIFLVYIDPHFPPADHPTMLIGGSIIFAEWCILCLLQNIGLPITIPVATFVTIMIRSMLCAAIGYLLGHELKWKVKGSILFFVLMIVGISTGLTIILGIILGIILLS